MPRPKNPSIEQNDDILRQIIGIFQIRLLNGLELKRYNVPKYSNEVEKVAERHGIGLKSDTLYQKLFSPYAEGDGAFLSKGYIEMISDLLLKIADLYKFTVEERTAVEALRAKISKVKPLVKVSDNIKVAKSGLASSVLSAFDDTKWNFYERIGDEDVKGGKWGIAIGELSFNSTSKVFEVELKFLYKGRERKYKGIATTDDSSHVYLELSLEKKKAYVMIRVTDVEPQFQTLLLGHFCFYSEAYRHMLSKTVVLEKHAPGVTTFAIGEYFSDVTAYDGIDQDIRWFLFDRKSNRMSFPKKVVTVAGDLKDFVDHRKGIDEANEILRHFYDNYYVYYKTINEEIIEDEFKLEMDGCNAHTQAVYIHRPDDSKRNNKNWRGRAYVNGDSHKRVVVLELSEVRSLKRKTPEDPILLTYHLPDEQINFDECECFSGLLTGLQDSSRAPVSYICLVVPQRLAGERTKDQRIVDYFKTDRTYRLVPHTQAFRFKDIDGKKGIG